MAQTTIQYGTYHSGKISSAKNEQFTFQGSNGEIVRIRLSGYHPQLEIYSEAGEQLFKDSNKDYSGIIDAHITLPANGQ